MSANTLLPSTERALLHRIAVEQRNNRAPSLVAAVVRDGRPVWVGGRGEVDAATPTGNTQYRIGSITKTFVAVAVLRLRDEGKLDLADPLERHVTGTAFGQLTIGQLLSQASGITAEPPGQWWERTPGRDWSELAASIGPEAVKLPAGRRFHYSNLGFAALGEVVAQLRGSDWWTVVREEILQPLEMRRTSLLAAAPHASGWAVHPWADVLLPEPAHDARGMAPAGQLWSTATDLARWTAFIGGDTADVLNPDTVAEMRAPVVVEDGDSWIGGYGLGLQVLRDRGRRLAGHGGSMPGFLATVWADPKERTGALALTNATSGPAIPTLVADLVDILAQHEPTMPGEWQPASEVDPKLLALTGPWYWGAAALAVRLAAGRWLTLSSVTRPDRSSRFRPVGEDTWIGLDDYYAGETLRVVRRPDGSVSHLDLNTFVLTREPYDPDAPVPGGVDPAGWRALG